MVFEFFVKISRICPAQARFQPRPGQEKRDAELAAALPYSHPARRDWYNCTNARRKANRFAHNAGSRRNMAKSSPHKVQIEQIGGPRHTWLELKGTVLVYHASTWAASFCAYIPVEWISVSHGSRMPGLRLLRSGALSATALAASLLFFALAFRPSAIHTVPTALEPVLQVAATLMAAPLLIAAVWFGSSAMTALRQRRPTTVLQVDESDMAIEFWRRDGGADLDKFVEDLGALQASVEDTASYPARVGHARRHVRPIRAVALKVLVTTLILYIPCKVMAAHLGMPLLMLFLALPAAVYFGRAGLDWLFMRREHPDFREAARHFHRAEFAEAEARLEALLRDEPRHEHGLLMYTQVLIMVEKFDEAFSACQQLHPVNPEAADAILEDLWALKRMHDRMQAQE